jgi:Uma2 family endonuclease
MNMRPEPIAIDYPYYEETVTESTWHAEAGQYLASALSCRYQARADVFVGSDNFVYWEEGNPDEKLAPDVYVCFGARRRGRRSYKTWEDHGVAPQVVIEISSRSSRHTDLGNKKAIYEEIGVEEYYVFDPLREYIPQGLRAFRRKGATFEEIVFPDKTVDPRVYSPRLELEGLLADLFRSREGSPSAAEGSQKG